MVKSFSLYKNFNIKNSHKNSIILIGNFDGLHSGHQKLFNLARKSYGLEEIDFSTALPNDVMVT